MGFETFTIAFCIMFFFLEGMVFCSVIMQQNLDTIMQDIMKPPPTTTNSWVDKIFGDEVGLALSAFWGILLWVITEIGIMFKLLWLFVNTAIQVSILFPLIGVINAILLIFFSLAVMRSVKIMGSGVGSGS